MHCTHPPSESTAAGYRQAGYWRTADSVAQHLRELSAGGPRIALVDADGEWPYSQLVAAAEHVRDLLGNNGVAAGDAVLIIASLRNAAAAAYLATVHCGAVAVLLDRRCGQSDLDNAHRAIRPRITLAHDDDWRQLGLSGPVISLDGIGDQPAGAAIGDSSLDPDAPAVVVFTSGTTSAPKGVIHTLNSLRCGTANMVNALGVGADDAFLLSSPLASITGVLQLESALAKHAKVVLEEKFTPATTLQRVVAHQVSILGGAPVIAESLFAEADRRGQPSLPLRCIAVGGTMIPPELMETATRFGVAAVRVYGSSEAPFSAATGMAAHDVEDDGAMLPGVQAAIGGADELLIQGPHQFHGYVDETQNADAFAGEWVRTGDQADIDGVRVRIKGRLKDIAVRKGMKISLAEIECAASGLGDCAAFAVPDEVTGERLALAIHTTAEVTYHAVVEHLAAAGLATWKLPEQIVLWSADLPRTPSGKVLRQQLTDECHRFRTFYAPRISR